MRDSALWDELRTGLVTRGRTKADLTAYLRTTYGCSAKSAEDVFEEYLKLLYLVSIAEVPCAAPPVLQDLWYEDGQTSLLEIETGDAISARDFKRFAHLGSRADHGVYAETFDMYVTEFGSRPPRSIWPDFRRNRVDNWFVVIFLTGCILGAFSEVFDVGVIKILAIPTFISGFLYFARRCSYWCWPPTRG
jgi:hypothetical protein